VCVEERLMYEIVMYKGRKEGKATTEYSIVQRFIIGEKRWDFLFSFLWAGNGELERKAKIPLISC